ncbi:hypothetical protein, partial [Terriglobus albidus]|uniref:hypothetical protein n=1 Tax=Terriglobus albidus TaxID=1592106 RepID=UPI0021E04A0F
AKLDSVGAVGFQPTVYRLDMKWALALGFFLAYRGGPGLKPVYFYACISGLKPAEHPIQQGWMGTPLLPPVSVILCQINWNLSIRRGC